MSFLGVATPKLFLLPAPAMPLLRAIYYSILLVHRIQMRYFPTLADAWLACYSSFSSTDSYGPAYASSQIPVDSACLLDSNETLPDWILQLAMELPHHLVSTPGGVTTDLSLVTATRMPRL